MSASSDYIRVLTDITQQEGATAAATQRANSAIWGNSIAKLGEFAGDAVKSYAVDKKAKKQEQEDQNLRDLFGRAQSEWEQSQQSSVQDLTQMPWQGGHRTLEQRAAGDNGYTPGDLSGNTRVTMPDMGIPGPRPQFHGLPQPIGAPTGGEMLPQPINARTGGEAFMGPKQPPRQSPFPTPSEIIKAVGPTKGIPIINGIAALHKTEEAKADPQKALGMLQAVAKGLDALPEDMRAQAYPGLIQTFESQGILQPGQLPKDYSSEYWKFIMGTGEKPKEPAAAKLAQLTVPGPDGKPITKFVEEKAGAEYPQYQKPEGVSTGGGSDYAHFLERFARDKNKKAEDLTSAEELAARKAYGQADDRTAGAQAADITKLTPQGLDMAALNYRKTGIMPPLGMGDRTTRQEILNRAAQLTPTDITRIEAGGTDVAGNKADYKADSTSLTALQKQRDAIGAFEQTAQKNIDNFLAVARKVPDTGIPLLNTPLRWAAGAGGSADVAKYQAARQVAISEIAKIVQNPNLTGQLSDSARHEIDVFNPQNATLKQTVAVMELLKQDMNNRKTALDSQLKETRGRIGGGDAGPKDGDTKPIPGYPGTEQTYRNGKWIRTK